jgi:serine/threonine protein kinase
MSEQHTRLPPGTRLEDFVIRETLGGGGFSIVYLAEETATGDLFVVKEYMPQRLARRNPDMTVSALSAEHTHQFNKGRMMFFQEASTLATLRHENIVNVRNFFRTNGTVYMAMYYEEGVNLQKYITRRGGKLSEQFLLTIFPPLLDALKLIHSRGFLHLDIKPGNIHLRHGGRPLLLDFGAVHQRQMSRMDQIGHITSKGFSPIEQFKRHGYMGPWSDIYSIGATMRACIEGKPPPPATDRYEEDIMKPAVEAFKRQVAANMFTQPVNETFKRPYSEKLLKAIDWAMEVDQELRPQSVDDFLEALPEAEPEKESLGSRLLKKISPKLARNR